MKSSVEKLCKVVVCISGVEELLAGRSQWVGRAGKAGEDIFISHFLGNRGDESTKTHLTQMDP
jgi:hypothetical protein